MRDVVLLGVLLAIAAGTVFALVHLAPRLQSLPEPDPPSEAQWFGRPCTVRHALILGLFQGVFFALAMTLLDQWRADLVFSIAVSVVWWAAFNVLTVLVRRWWARRTTPAAAEG